MQKPGTDVRKRILILAYCSRGVVGFGWMLSPGGICGKRGGATQSVKSECERVDELFVRCIALFDFEIGVLRGNLLKGGIGSTSCTNDGLKETENRCWSSRDVTGDQI